MIVEYGKGITVNNTTAILEAITARHNSGAALTVSGTANLTVDSLLLQFNEVGVQVNDTAQLTVRRSVIKNNTLNAQSTSTNTPNLQENWWGVLSESAVESLVSGTVDVQNFLTNEPVLNPAVGIANHATTVGDQNITLWLPSRNAEEVRVSEDSSFNGVFYDAWQQNPSFTLSANGGEKTVYAQYRSITGNASDIVSVTLRLVTEGPLIQPFAIDDGQVISRPLTVNASASSTLGLARIDFLIDGAIQYSTNSPSLSYEWDPRTLSDGIYRIRIDAVDVVGNVSSIERNVQIEIAPPSAPILTAPIDGTVLGNLNPITVSGTAEPGVQVQVRRNGFVVGTPIADENGLFSVSDVTLAEGDSVIQATASDLSLIHI